MQPNVGGLDRGIRFMVGMALLGYAIFGFYFSARAAFWPGLYVALAAIVGLVSFLTAALRKCPINKAFGWNTCDEGASEEPY